MKNVLLLLWGRVMCDKWNEINVWLFCVSDNDWSWPCHNTIDRFLLTFSCKRRLKPRTSSFAVSNWCDISKWDRRNASSSAWIANDVSSSSARDTWPRTRRWASSVLSASNNSFCFFNNRFSLRSRCGNYQFRLSINNSRSIFAG